ncbi:hypothetical protein Pla175_19230 [Pirellulimonas nuda]|uniref:Carboxypeptidase regulatory-like domain-containing protein n=1 Tax=Pirellulimonas nuda TaxID=2528009 RepID=A0A518DAN5_9BACT|nr:hypothetical protein [Pirellulimonas nuda]QDU88545.1 hypothetical protein Pla175_19230 [Pirellulimonas nuda]
MTHPHSPNLNAAARLNPLRWTIAGVLLCACVGCDDRAGPRPVTGEVTWGGSPLLDGYVTFRPAGAGRGSGSAIKDGRFSIASARGLDAGEYRVVITSQAPTGRQIPNPEVPGEKISETKQAIPIKYNDRTELTAQVEPGGQNHFIFALDKQ